MDGHGESRTRDDNNNKKKGGQGAADLSVFFIVVVTNYTQNVAVQTANTYMCNSTSGVSGCINSVAEGGGRSVVPSVGRKLVLSFFSSLASIILSRLLYAGCLVSIYSSSSCTIQLCYVRLSLIHILAFGSPCTLIHTRYIIFFLDYFFFFFFNLISE